MYNQMGKNPLVEVESELCQLKRSMNKNPIREWLQADRFSLHYAMSAEDEYAEFDEEILMRLSVSWL